jgi:Bacterial SH3 domain
VVSGSIPKVIAAGVVFFLAGCRVGGQRKAPAIGEAYVGPALLNLRRDISMQSPTVATVKHGDRVEIIGQRRVFLRLRTAGGVEGWTTASQLMSAADMEDMKRLAERAAKMPAQGEATVYDSLNVHSQPSSRSPSFMQLRAKEKFAVLGHVVTPRIDLPHPPLVPPAPKKAPPVKKETPPSGKIVPPPMPKPPPLPQNWQAISRPTMADDETPAEDEEPAAPPVPDDDWSLIRTAAGQTGWVLTRRLTMAIPDDVAQYAEGRRIVTYFSLGTIDDGDAKKDVWLWTTIGEGRPPYDFDSFRVFIWSLRRHRYETAYIERNIQGFEPVRLDQFDYSGAGTAKGAPVKYPGFSICMRKKDGTLARRNYVLLTNIVRFAGESGCELPPPVFNIAALPKPGAKPVVSAPVAAPEPAADNRSFTQRIKSKLSRLLHHGKQ